MSRYLTRFKAVIPAGGSGSRLGAAVPKQYLPIGQAAMIEHSVRALLRADWVDMVVVVVAPDDRVAASLLGGSDRVQVLPQGGVTRRDSVLAGVRFLNQASDARADDWIMVHDAARPALSLGALERLRDAVSGWTGGALLAVPVADTVKREQASAAPFAQIAATIDREGLWLAQTPQVGRAMALQQALERFPEVTDEASALEAAGIEVRLVPGERRNFKVTTGDDLDMMRALLVKGDLA
ncbi:MAG: 2-C-methyl-D-erythritol 4-phosphate cytidylyltransferase [Pseudomonadota bacterium]|jgi:2-C-methyl-D-erythritol 4-phosphate cytidylyltransferase